LFIMYLNNVSITSLLPLSLMIVQAFTLSFHTKFLLKNIFLNDDGRDMKPTQGSLTAKELDNVFSLRLALGLGLAGLATDAARLGTDTVGLGTDTAGLGTDTAGLGTDTAVLGTNTASLAADDTCLATNHGGLATNATCLATETVGLATQADLRGKTSVLLGSP